MLFVAEGPMQFFCRGRGKFLPSLRDSFFSFAADPGLTPWANICRPFGAAVVSPRPHRFAAAGSAHDSGLTTLDCLTGFAHDSQLTTALLNNLRDGAGAYRVAAFADREAQALLHRHRRDQLDHQAHVV